MLNSLKEKTVEYLYGLQKVAAFKPLESTHLLQKTFEKGDLDTRLAAFRTAIFSPHIGDGKLIGDLFVKLMAATTKEERKEIVEPFLLSLLEKSSSNISKASEGKLAWLNALYHGWKLEEPA